MEVREFGGIGVCDRDSVGVEGGGAESAGDDGAGHVSAAEDDEEGVHVVTVDSRVNGGTVILGET